MKKVFLALSISFLLIASSGYAAVDQIVCEIDLSSCPWTGDNSTWTEKSGVYPLTIQCTEEGYPISGYRAEFDILLNKGEPPQYNLITILKTYSTVTDSDGKAQINVPLLHIPIDSGYVHICPFDDIIHVGGAIEETPSESFNAIGGPRSVVAGLNLSCFPIFKKGCCETTITVTCCTPNRVFKYCSYATQLQCVIGSIDPDPCTNITTTWSSTGVCSYCTGVCETEQVIELVSFKALKSFGKVTLLWETASETNNAGFNIYRAENKNAEYVKINKELIPAQGSTTQGASYEYIDTSVKSMKAYYYKLEDVDTDGTTTQYDPVKAMPKVLYDIFN